MELYKSACEIKDEIIAHRRYLHKNAETGLYLPLTVEYIKKVLTDYGIRYSKCGHGIVAEIGHGSPVVLLRADMDALPMKELSGEAFASGSDSAAHTCGHDMHAAMLLGASRLLSQAEHELCGTARLMFEPGEELLSGCLNMMDSGLLKGDEAAAFALHTAAGQVPIGTVMYNAGGVMMFSADNFTVNIKGKGGHGAYAGLTADPVRAAVRIYDFLSTLTESEGDPVCRASISIGYFHSGSAGNVIPETALIKGSLRTDGVKNREHLKLRMEEAILLIAELSACSAELVFDASVPPLVCDSDLTLCAAKYFTELGIPGLTFVEDITAAASEDFACIAERLPSVYMYLSAGFDGDDGKYVAHDPRVRFNEEACSMGAAMYAQFAIRTLQDLEH